MIKDEVDRIDVEELIQEFKIELTDQLKFYLKEIWNVT